MATAFNAQLNVQLNAQSLNTASKEIRQSLGRITGSASEFQKSLDASTARVFAFGATTLVINGITQSFKALVATTIDVEKKLIEIDSIFGGTASQFASFRDSIFNVAKSTGQSFSVVADGAAEFARQGLSATETAKRLEAALILTRVSGLDSVKSVNALTSAINGFTSAGLTAAQITNKLVAVDTAFAVSAQDLAEGFSRAGSTAEDAGVSFDELLGIITAVQQKTARGGAVIGNALKSVFTRLSRSSTIADLQELGVAIDSSQSGIQKLQALSNALQQISDPNQASAIKELAGGVYQINIVSAALKDLSSQSSIFSQATATSAKATNEAYSKNEQLNKSLAAQINQLIAGVTNLAEKAGQLTFAPLLSNLVGIATKISEFFDKALDPEKGNAFIQGIFKAIGNFISGPGLVLITGAFLRIVSLVTKFAKEGFESVMKIGSAEEKIQKINSGITRELLENEKFRTAILSKTLTQEQKEQIINKTILERNKLYNDQKMLIEAISRVALKSGVTGYESGVGYVNKRNQPIVKAGGFTPSFAETMAETSAAREHGYKAGKVYNTRLYDGSGGSFKATVNSAEKVKTVRGENGKLGTYVIPPNGFAGKGFVPNYASLSTQSTGVLKKYAAGIGRNITPQKQKEAAEILRAREGGSVNINQLLASQGINELPTVLTPNTNGLLSKTKQNFMGSGKNASYSFKAFGVRNSGVDKLGDEATKAFGDAEIERFAESKVLPFARLVSASVGGNPVTPDSLKDVNKTKGFVGAVRGAFGGLFDAAISTALDLTSSQKDGGDFDVRLGRNPAKTGEIITQLFGSGSLGSGGLGDFKIGGGDTTIESMIGKTNKEYASLLAPTNAKNKASGFIPNFASYVYDSDRIPADKGATLKAILASKAKKNLLIAPSGAGKSTVAAKYGKFLSGASDVSKASEINLLSGAARAKGGGMSKQLESLLDSVNASGGKVSYLHVKNMEIMKRRMGRASLEGDLRSEKQLKGTKFAPLNQFDFVKAVKARAKKFEVLNAAEGFVPNFARKELGYGAFGTFSSLGKRKGREGEVGVKAFRADTTDSAVEKEWLTAEYLSKYVKSLQPIVFFPPNLSSYDFAMKKKKVLKPVISDPLAKDALRGQGVADPFGERFLSAAIEAASGVKIRDLHGGNYTVNTAAQEAIKAFDFTKSYSGQEAYAMLKGMTGAKFGAFDVGVNSLSETALKNLETIKKRQLAKQATKKAFAKGFAPNFSAIGDAINREKAAGVPTSKIYLDSSPQLKSSRNPMGMMVANSLDEPIGGFQGINRARKEGRNPKTYGAAGGFVPNYVGGNLSSFQGMKTNQALQAVEKKTNELLAKLNTKLAENSKASLKLSADTAALNARIQQSKSQYGGSKPVAGSAGYTDRLQDLKDLRDKKRQKRKLERQFDSNMKARGKLRPAEANVEQAILSSTGNGLLKPKTVGGKSLSQRAGGFGRKVGGGLTGGLGGIFGFSAVAGLIGEAKETDSNMAAASKQILGTTAQFAAAGAAFGPLGTAVGALAGVMVTAYNSISGAQKSDKERRAIEVDSGIEGVAIQRARLLAERSFKSKTAEELGVDSISDIIQANKKGNIGIDTNAIKEAQKKVISANKQNYIDLQEARKNNDPAKIKAAEESRKAARKAEKEYAAALEKAIEQIRVGNRAKDIGKLVDQFGSEFARTALLIKKVNDELDQKISNLDLLGGIETNPNDPYSSALKNRQRRASDTEMALRDRGAVDEQFNSPLFADAVKEAVIGFKKYSFAEVNTGLPAPFSQKKSDQYDRRRAREDTFARSIIPPDTRPREKIGGLNLVPLSEYKPFDLKEFEKVLGGRELTFEEAKSKLNLDPTKLGRKAIDATAFDPANGLRKTLGGVGIDTTKGAGLKFSEAAAPKLQKSSDSIKKTVTSTVNDITRLNAGLEELDKKIAENVTNLFDSITKGFSGKKIGTADFAKKFSDALNEKDLDKQGQAFKALAPQAEKIKSELGTEYFNNLIKSVGGKGASDAMANISARAATSQFASGDIIDNSRDFLSGSGRRRVSNAEQKLISDPTNKSKIDDLIKALRESVVGEKGRKEIAPIIASLEARKNTDFGEKGQRDLEKDKDALKIEMADAESHLATLNAVFSDSQLPSAITALSIAMNKAAREVNAFKDMAAAMESLNNEAVTKMVEAQGTIKSLSFKLEEIRSLTPNP